MPKFKVGDEVRCIENYYHAAIVGDIKTVLKVRYDNQVSVLCSCCPENPQPFYLTNDHFELYIRQNLNDLLEKPNELFKFLKQQLDIMN